MTDVAGRGTAPARLVANRYWLLRELGRGGMGIVWLADDQLIARPVAVKELRPPQGLPAAEGEVLARRAVQEARSAGRVRHPGAVTLFDVIPAADGAVYLIMEYVEGSTLAQLIQSQGRLPDAAAAGYGLQLLDVLAAAHALGIVHRDVKPANIMITAGGQVKLTDFGIAHIAGDARLTRSGVMGTQAYMAPELFDAQPITPAADLWALGATLYAATSGHGPFDRDTTAATLRAILIDDIPAPRCGPALAAAITSLLQRDPAQRATIEQARAALRRTETETTVTPQPGLDRPPAAYEEAETTLSRTGPPAEPPPTAPAPRRKPSRRIVIAAATATAVVIAGCVAGAVLRTVPRPRPGPTPASTIAPLGLRPLAPTATLDDPAAETVGSMSFGSDGRLLTSGDTSTTGENDGAWLWNATTGQEVSTGVNPDAFQSVAALSPDGSTMAFANTNQNTFNTDIDVWNIAASKVTATLAFPALASGPNATSTPSPNVLAFSPDGTMLAIGDGGNPNVYVYDIATGAMATLTNSSLYEIDSLAFSPDGTMLAAGDAQSGQVSVWNLASHGPAVTLSIPDASGNSALHEGGIAFSPDSGTLAVADDEKGVLLWNVKTHGWGPSMAVSASAPQDVVAYSPDGTTLVTGGVEGGITLWNVARRTAITSWALPDNAVPSVIAFSPDGKALAAGSANGSAYLWNIAGRRTAGT